MVGSNESFVSKESFVHIKPDNFPLLGYVRCLVDYPCHPNVCNLDAHMTREGHGQMWSLGNDSIIKKLTWVTLGYHYNWSTKVYIECSIRNYNILLFDRNIPLQTIQSFLETYQVWHHLCYNVWAFLSKFGNLCY